MRIYLAIMGFNNPTVIRNAIERFFEQTDIEGLPIREFILFDGKYPLPDPVVNRTDFETIAKEKKFQLIKFTKNEGQNQNFNLVVNAINALYAPQPQDILAFWEPDSHVLQKNWLKACCEVMADKSKHNIGFVTPKRWPSWILENNHVRWQVAGHKCRKLSWPGGWPMGIYSWGFIEAMKTLPVSHEYYGGTEMNILVSLERSDHSGLMFEDIEDRSNIDDFDQLYITWKAETIHIKKGQGQMDFEDWLRKYGHLK